MNDYPDICILIPSFNPDEKLPKLVKKLSRNKWKKIIIIDDGSSQGTVKYFHAISQADEVILLSHRVNHGKGAALKTGFDYIKNNEFDAIGIITVDADGQHLVKDIEKVAQSAMVDNNEVIFGVRRFNNQTPFASILGNKIMSYLLNWMNGIAINDTQTGLRYLPLSVVDNLIKLPGMRYEFELECLVNIKKNGLIIKEVEIEAVYLDKNKGSHFRGFLDSSRVLLVFFRYSVISISSFGLDILLFALLLTFYESIIYATIFARVISGSFNFISNKLFAFRSSSIAGSFRELTQYLALWGILVILSASIVSISKESSLHVTLLLKVFVDLGLFFLAFYVQKNFIFNQLNSSKY